MMRRKIVGFHTDEVGDCVATLECGPGRHMRHMPPREDRPWVLTREGRQRQVERWICAERLQPV